MRVADDKLESTINVTPLVDVCLVLLIIFMVVTPMVVNGVDVDLPPAVTAESFDDGDRQLLVTLEDDGTVYVGAVVMRREHVRSELAAHAAADERGRNVIVRSDGRVRYGDVLDVLEACRAAGFADVGLAAKRVVSGTAG